MKTLKYCLLTVLVVSFAACNQKPTKKKLSKAERIALMAEMEIEMTKDPATGLVPKEKLYDIRQEIIKKSYADDSRDGEEWVSRGPNNQGGRTRAVLIDSRDPSGNTLYVGSVGGGLWKVTDIDTNPTWERVKGYTGNPSVCALAQDPNNPEILFAGTGEGWFNGDAYRGDGIYRSTNGGEDWTRLLFTSFGFFNHTQKLLFTQDGNLLAATRESGVQMSTNGGSSWAPVLSNTNQGFSNRAADLEITADGTIFASMGINGFDGIYKSVDGGFQWTFQDIGIEDYERIDLATSENDPNIVMALVQDPETNGVGYILRSTDQGETWDQVTVAQTFSGGNFARNQAWYDLSITIDPNNSDVAFIGGINLYKTEDGGQTWNQLSEWFDNPSIQNVHADQHSAQFINGDSNRALFSNDGGVYLTQDATSPLPDIRAISDGYISTQFYACGIHPEAGRDFFIAGAQDNGTHELTTPGLGSSREVIGGDGAYCHIGQNNPNFMIGATQRGGFVAAFGGDLSQGGGYGHEGESYFINPSEIDDINTFVYESSDQGTVYRTDILANSQEFVNISALSNQRVSALKIDPHDPDILYLGTSGGRIVKVTNPRSENPESEFLFGGSGFTRSIEVDHLDQNKLLVTYSNFGVQSVFTSSDGGDTWRNIEGDLPDIPVRWGIFNPRNNNQAIIATEVGIWQADINEPSVEWNNISAQIGLTRVDMLKARSSDLEVLAASYGKGLWTSSSFSEPGLKFFNEIINIEPVGTTDGDFCDPVDTRVINIGSALPFEMDVEVTISVDPNGSAVEGLDFELESTTATLLAGETSVAVKLFVFDNATIDGDKTINLTLTSDQEIIGSELEINLIDNDSQFATSGSNSQTFIGNGEELNSSIFNGAWEGVRTQILYKSEFLAEYGAGGQFINRLVFDVEEKLSEIPYENFNVSMALIGSDTLSHLEYKEDADLIPVFSGSVDTKVGTNIVKLDAPFLYDGTSNLLIEICFDNDETTDIDFMFGTSTDYVSTVRSFNDGETGCPSEGDLEVLNQVPNMRFRSSFPVSLFSDEGKLFSSTIEPDLTAYFSSNDSIVCAATNEGVDDVCFSASLFSASGDVIAKDKMLWIDRIYDISSSSDDDQTITLYYSTIGSEEWYDEDIEGLFTSEKPTEGTLDWDAVELISVEEQDDYIAFTMPYSGVGYYSVGQEFYALSNNNIDLDLTYDQVRIFDISGRLISDSDKIGNEVPTGIYIKTYINQGAVVKSEKMFVE